MSRCTSAAFARKSFVSFVSFVVYYPRAMHEPPVSVSDYDRFAYPRAVYSHTHPDRLATIAILHGLQPAPVANARVLELGCGDGNNLISIACTLPVGEFLGVDLAGEPIRRGQEAISAIGLKNISLRQMNILEMPADVGTFDYIIAHGVYSWVPEAVREKVLGICREHLAENGVAYISYNAYPGCHLRDVARGIMLFHARQFSEPSDQVQQGRALIKFLAQGRTEPRLWQVVLQAQLQRLEKRADGSLFHDDFSPVCQAFYFHEFVEAAGRHQLEFLAEADVKDARPDGLTDEAVGVLQKMGQMNRIAYEQYIDFIGGCSFRRTLLCRQGRAVDREMKPERVCNLFVAANVAAVNPDANTPVPGPEDFKRGETVIAASMPVLKSALKFLGEAWPRRVPFAELLENACSVHALACSGTAPRADPGGDGTPGHAEACASGGPTPEHAKACTPNEPHGTDEGSALKPVHQTRADLAEFLLSCFAIGFVDLHSCPSPFVTKVSERPMASPLVRWQVRQGPEVSTLRHWPLRITDAMGRHLLGLLDGTRDHAALLKELGESVKAGSTPIYCDGKAVTESEKAVELVAQRLGPSLENLAKLGLLAG